MTRQRVLRPAAFSLALLFVAAPYLGRVSEAQGPCSQVGNHTIRVGKIQECQTLVDCEGARISKRRKHGVTWIATGNYTFAITFPQGSPFDNFTCTNVKKCTSGPASGTATPDKEYKYDVQLIQDGNVVCVQDPRILIQN